MAKRVKKYKVHQGYISVSGQRIAPGIYGDDVIDVQEARLKSIITLEDMNFLSLTTELTTNELTVTHLDEAKADTITKKLEPTVTQSVTVKFPINKATEKEFDKLPGLTNTVVKKVIANRPFKTYAELNKKVSLSKKRKWEDFPIDFDYVEDESYIKFNGYDF